MEIQSAELDIGMECTMNCMHKYGVLRLKRKPRVLEKRHALVVYQQVEFKREEQFPDRSPTFDVLLRVSPRFVLFCETSLSDEDHVILHQRLVVWYLLVKT